MYMGITSFIINQEDLSALAKEFFILPLFGASISKRAVKIL